jgi:sugar phosphate isomerase/epimerase
MDMIFGLTTRWNASRHTSGEKMVEEILSLGLDHLELGYDLRMDLVPGLHKMVREGTVKVDSVHNFCPVPIGAPRGHPELFTLASADRKIREGAVHHTLNTIRFAADVGAKVVIVHAGNVEMSSLSADLRELCEKGEQFSARYDKIKLRLQLTREKKVLKQLDYLRQGIEQLIPAIAESRVQLALENLPTWEAIPSELEMEDLCRRYAPQGLRYWHDIGHSQIRQNLGFINQERWIERLQPYMAGMHIHDVVAPTMDHLLPPHGQVDFTALKKFAKGDIIRVIEPASQTSGEAIVEALRFLRQAWE